MAADNVAEMSIFSKIENLYSCGWDAMVLGNETATFLENQTKLKSSALGHITSDSGNLVGNYMPKITSVDEAGCHSDFSQDHCPNPPNAKRKKNVSSRKVHYSFCIVFFCE